MLEQYKKTFLNMQLVIGVVTVCLLGWSHLWSVAATFFFVMQLGAVVGAMWGARLRAKLLRWPGGA